MWRTTSRVWYLDFHREGVFKGVNGTSTNLDRSVWHQVVVGQPARAASIDFLHRLGLLLLM
jgi:hypothetical protein